MAARVRKTHPTRRASASRLVNGGEGSENAPYSPSIRVRRGGWRRGFASFRGQLSQAALRTEFSQLSAARPAPRSAPSSAQRAQLAPGLDAEFAVDPAGVGAHRLDAEM